MQNLGKIMEVSSTAMSMMSKLKAMRSKYDRRMRIQRGLMEEECKKRQAAKKFEENKNK